MSQAMKDAVKKKLTTVREETVRVLNGLTEEQWQAPVYSDEGAEWRVIDVVRHVADSERGMTALMAQVQAGGEGVPADFEGITVFLASAASDFVTGTAIPVDGGYSSLA